MTKKKSLQKEISKKLWEVFKPSAWKLVAYAFSWFAMIISLAIYGVHGRPKSYCIFAPIFDLFPYLVTLFPWLEGAELVLFFIFELFWLYALSAVTVWIIETVYKKITK